ncbi:hypothetical protein ACFQZT_28515 [Paenibacillus sp. GCM10027628]|uniref:hypothetical protein n=1 Tax=Paenibacillus sp. GCM10027628 TaxID=3273413 RepID=UPI003641EB01
MQPINQRIEAILPILLPLPIELDFDEITNQVIKELISSEYIFPLKAEQLSSYQVIVKFQLLDESDSRINFFKTETLGRKKIFLLAYTTMEIIDKPVAGIESWNIPSIVLWSKISVDHFIKRLYDFIICINIARVGSIRVDQGVIFIDNQFYQKLKMMNNNFQEVFLFTQKTRWPVLEHLEIHTVWNWITEKAGFLDGVGGTPVDRALTALTYLFGSNGETNEGMDLFFTMIGLESLYCTSNNGIKEQLLEKSQVFLGKQTDYKKLFKGMYDYRSKFIHGSLNFPVKYHFFDGSDEYDQFMKDSYDATLMAQSVLIATLQQLSKRNMNELNFEYTLVD